MKKAHTFGMVAIAATIALMVAVSIIAVQSENVQQDNDEQSIVDFITP